MKNIIIDLTTIQPQLQNETIDDISLHILATFLLVDLSPYTDRIAEWMKEPYSFIASTTTGQLLKDRDRVLLYNLYAPLDNPHHVVLTITQWTTLLAFWEKVSAQTLTQLTLARSESKWQITTTDNMGNPETLTL